MYRASCSALQCRACVLQGSTCQRCNGHESSILQRYRRLRQLPPQLHRRRAAHCPIASPGCPRLMVICRWLVGFVRLLESRWTASAYNDPNTCEGEDCTNL